MYSFPIYFDLKRKEDLFCCREVWFRVAPLNWGGVRWVRWRLKSTKLLSKRLRFFGSVSPNTVESWKIIGNLISQNVPLMYVEKNKVNMGPVDLNVTSRICSSHICPHGENGFRQVPLICQPGPHCPPRFPNRRASVSGGVFWPLPFRELCSSVVNGPSDHGRMENNDSFTREAMANQDQFPQVKQFGLLRLCVANNHFITLDIRIHPEKVFLVCF